MTGVIDFKKTQRELYQPGGKPSVLEVPEMVFIMVDGQGDPNTSADYQNAVELLYGLSYAIKMSKKGGTVPEGYYDFVVPPLEGLWQVGGGNGGGDFGKWDKSGFRWTSMIRQPEFVTPEVFAAAKAVLARKKPGLDLAPARLETYAEGLCAQVLHVGSYDEEPETINALFDFIAASGFRVDVSETRKHHEIYLGDPRKTAPEKLKTVIRYPIATAARAG
ncbi:MAG: GyrI-like domain-containing protein [Clostridiales Family XIII bacterium]|jgi:hypothetical protein|nr:GyrI-like domain-containing protein [Clostridiales Family XIII bacterium]